METELLPINRRHKSKDTFSPNSFQTQCLTNASALLEIRQIVFEFNNIVSKQFKVAMLNVCKSI